MEEENFKRILDSIRQTRKVFSELIAHTDPMLLNTIPAGFNNNIAWNYGHIYVTTPALIYQRSGINPRLEIPFQAAYGKGSRPAGIVPPEEIGLIMKGITDSIDQIEADWGEGLFDTGITAFSTSTYGAELLTIGDVLLTTLMHDNLHLGYAQAQRRALSVA